MKLSILERIILLNLLPKEGNIATIKTIKALSEVIALTEEEQKQCNFSSDDKGLKWDRTKEPTLDHEFSGPQTKLVVEQLEKLNEEKKILVEHLTLCEKFGIE